MLSYNAISALKSSAPSASMVGQDFDVEDLQKPSRDEILRNAARTAAAFSLVVDKAIAKTQPGHVAKQEKREAIYVRYNSAQQTTTGASQRILQIREAAVDPLEPSRFRVRESGRRPPSPPPAVLHSPPRKLTAEEQENWKIPPSLSNWINPKGYIIPLDKRAAFDGRGLIDHTISDKFAIFSEAMYVAERTAREQINQRNAMERKRLEKERLAEQARLKELAMTLQQQQHVKTEDEEGPLTEEERRAEAQREALRREKRAEIERELRMEGKKAADGKIKTLAERERDLHERLALGQGIQTGGGSGGGSAVFDESLFARDDGGLAAGMGEDDGAYNLYDKPLFAASAARGGLYRPSRGEDLVSDATHAEENLEKLRQGNSARHERSGPVQFERAADDDIVNRAALHGRDTVKEEPGSRHNGREADYDSRRRESSRDRDRDRESDRERERRREQRGYRERSLDRDLEEEEEEEEEQSRRKVRDSQRERSGKDKHRDRSPSPGRRDRRRSRSRSTSPRRRY